MQPTIVLARSSAGFPGGSPFGNAGFFNISFCQLGCDTAYALCTAGCTALSGGVGIVACVLLCSAAYQACTDGCK